MFCNSVISGVTESLFRGPKGGGKTLVWGGADLSLGGGLEDGIAMRFFSPSHLLCTIKIQMGEPMLGGHGVNGGHAPQLPPHTHPIVTPLSVSYLGLQEVSRGVAKAGVVPHRVVHYSVNGLLQLQAQLTTYR